MALLRQSWLPGKRNPERQLPAPQIAEDELHRPLAPPSLYPALQGSKLRCARVEIGNELGKAMHEGFGGHTGFGLQPVLDCRPCVLERIDACAPAALNR